MSKSDGNQFFRIISRLVYLKHVLYMSKRRRHINNIEINNFKILSIDRDRIMWNPIIKDVKKCHYKYQFPKLYITHIDSDYNIIEKVRNPPPPKKKKL